MESPENSWNATGWAEQFLSTSRQREHGALHRLRADVFQGTAAVVRNRGYAFGASRVDLDADGHYDELHQRTIFYTATDEIAIPARRRGVHETAVSVEDADCLDVARRLAADGSAPAVLNMASRRNPGGGVLRGAGAQEENLFRRSNLLWSLYQFVDYGREYDVPPARCRSRYPIPRESGGIYSPPTTVFRSSEPSGYAFLERPYRVAFLTVPAIPNPDLEERAGLPWLSSAMEESTRRKIRGILRIAAIHDHEDLVLSAFGCGAFRNPPHHMARLFHETLKEPEFGGVFRSIVFAVIDDHNAYRPGSPEGNFKPFSCELGGG